MIFTAKQTEQYFLFQNNKFYRWYSDYNAKLINDAYFRPKYPLRVYLVEHLTQTNKWEYFLIDFRYSKDGEVFYASDNATEMLEYILEHIIFMKTTQKKVIGTRYNNYCKKYNVKAVASLLVGFLCLFFTVNLFGLQNIKNAWFGWPIDLINGVVCGLVGIAFSKIMYDEKS